MTSFVIAAPPVYGETMPLLQIALGLVERGHEVTVMAGTCFADQVRATGAHHVALTGAADYDGWHIDEAFPERAGLAPGPDQLNHTFAHLSGDGIADQHRALQQLLRQDPDLVVVCDSVFLGLWPVALGAPGLRPRRWLAVGCNPLGLTSADTTPFGPVPAGPDGDAATANLAANAALQAALEPSRHHIERILRALGASRPVPGFMDGIVTLPDVFCALTVPDFEFVRNDAPPTLHFVGLLPTRTPQGWAPPLWWPDLQDDRPVVVVTQGTFDNRDLDELVRPALDALADEDVLVVAALGRPVEDLVGAVPPNARVEAYVPFADLLPHADVLLSNGGFGGTQQALAAGVPVIVAGATEDKPLTAARVVSHGVGLDLATSTPTREQIVEATRSVLGNEALRAGAVDLARVYARYDPLDLIERLALH